MKSRARCSKNWKSNPARARRQNVQPRFAARNRTTMRIFPGLLGLLALLLAGCGPPRFFAVEEMDEKALRAAPSFRAEDVEWTFARPAEWEISDHDWREMRDNSNRTYLHILDDNGKRPIYMP